MSSSFERLRRIRGIRLHLDALERARRGPSRASPTTPGAMVTVGKLAAFDRLAVGEHHRHATRAAARACGPVILCSSMTRWLRSAHDGSFVLPEQPAATQRDGDAARERATNACDHDGHGLAIGARSYLQSIRCRVKKSQNARCVMRNVACAAAMIRAVCPIRRSSGPRGASRSRRGRCATVVRRGRASPRAQSSADKWWPGYGGGPDNSRYFASRQIDKSQRQPARRWPGPIRSATPAAVRSSCAA